MADLLDGAAPATTPAPETTVVATPVEFPEYLKGIEVGDDIKGDPMLRTFKNIGDVVKSYVHAKRMIGAEKLPVPTKNSTPEEWKEVFHKLGLPKETKDYGINKKENSKITDDFINAFKTKAHNAGILPTQAQAIMDFYEDQIIAGENKLNTDYKAQEETELNGLKKEWGAAFEQNVKKANIALSKYGNPEMVEMLQATGMGNNAHLIKFLAKVNDSVGEDSFKGDAGVHTPSNALSEMNSIRGNKSHPYYDKESAGHKDALALMEKLAQQAYTK